jgi:hypothetical protein
MCGSKIGKIINKVTSLHDKLDPIGKPLRDSAEDALGLPRSGEIGTALFPEPVEIGATQIAKSPEAPTEVDGGVLAAREDERRRRAAAAGQNSTILTGGLGSANTGQKTLLGA